jgi:L-fuculose-phosphate aldolase
MDGQRDAIHAGIERDMARHLGAAPRGAAEEFALAARILAAHGHATSLAGQITERAGPGRYRTLPLGLGFEEATPAHVLEVDDDLKVIAGPGMPNPAVRFHAWIYRARPDVRAIVHTHPPAANALSMIGRPMVVAHMDAMALYDDVAFLPVWPGVPLADEEGRIISEALGDKRNILLAHHGLLSTGANIREATYRAVYMEFGCRMQLEAEAAGAIRPVDRDAALATRDFLNKREIVDATFALLARRAERYRQ